MTGSSDGGPRRCPDCGTEIAPLLLSCPACGRLVHGDELRRLATAAAAASDAGDPRAALAAWREALDRLPPASRQAAAIADKVERLSRQVDAGGGKGGSGEAKERPAWAKGGGALAALGLLLWKFKFVLGFVFTKGKLLLLGLTKAGTLFSMLLSAGLYWTLWGWKFAFGLVLSLYVHEMGHVAALHRFGIRATAPMFIPGLGAVVRLKQYPASPMEDARVGLAGPIWGVGAVLAAYGLHLATGWDSLAAIARFSAWINLFNLLPVWQLDGGRGFRALNKSGRWWVVAAIGVMWFLTEEGLLALLLLAGGLRALAGSAPEESDRTTLWQFIALIVALSLASTLPVPGIGSP
ncbi:MAG: site-2 protease family protein [Thermoanaerobaculia bacterium]